MKKENCITVLVGRRNISQFVKACKRWGIEYRFKCECSTQRAQRMFLWYEAFPKSLMEAYLLGAVYRDNVNFRETGLL